MMDPEAQPQEAPRSMVGTIWEASTQERADDDIQEVAWRVIDEPMSKPMSVADTPTVTQDNGHLLVALATAEQQLAAAKNQIAQLESLMEDLPAIFERKFKQRLQPVLERQEQLLADNRDLEQQIRQLAPAPGEVRLRFNPDAREAHPETAIRLPQLPAQASAPRNPRADRRGRRRRAA